MLNCVYSSHSSFFINTVSFCLVPFWLVLSESVVSPLDVSAIHNSLSFSCSFSGCANVHLVSSLQYSGIWEGYIYYLQQHCNTLSDAFFTVAIESTVGCIDCIEEYTFLSPSSPSIHSPYSRLSSRAPISLLIILVFSTVALLSQSEFFKARLTSQPIPSARHCLCSSTGSFGFLCCHFWNRFLFFLVYKRDLSNSSLYIASTPDMEHQLILSLFFF